MILAFVLFCFLIFLANKTNPAKSPNPNKKLELFLFFDKDIINNNEINNSSIQTITPETDNFKKFEVANLNNNYKNILGV